ncbi:antibiotic biosynthesis monooxygenase [Thermosynechococcaceae cyanobacterium BACA0444]|uniref:Antibiotic biosynthesis monooxygenase n=1 Tax=Pseudocalidococcus azoricus BACA0444 TaxID=2918990 RepID=A0AAE4FR98_9CYAN|nr:antibiotic biosynthesis monooxygenase [Pseudocalidococcus azoricus]MDS3860824.1 antibiotic biosynthesis monooxygenase [Pseudocalidococcus azoricus BACA0444]
MILPQPTAAAIALISFQIKPGCLDDYQSWQEQVSQTLARYPGFLGHEVLPPRPGIQADWVVIFRFRTLANLEQWLNSAEREALLKTTTDIFIAPAKQQILLTDNRPGQLVSVIFTNRVKPGYEQAFQKWHEKATMVHRQFSGFVSFDCFPPHYDTDHEWVDVVQFDSPDHLNAWLASPQRQKLLKELEPLVESFEVRPVVSSFAGWFPARVNSSTPTPPPPWKQAIAVILCLYPTVMIINLTIAPYFPRPLATSMLLGNIISVGFLTWLGMPFVNQKLQGWLRPQQPSVKTDLVGIITVGLVVGMIWLIFYNLTVS